MTNLGNFQLIEALGAGGPVAGVGVVIEGGAVALHAQRRRETCPGVEAPMGEGEARGASPCAHSP